MPPRVADVQRVIDHWRPDVMVHEIGELAAPLVATRAGIPFATHGFGPALPYGVVRAAADAARPLWSALAPHPTGGLYEHLYLDVCPPSLQTGELPPTATIQPVSPHPLRPRPKATARWEALRAAGRPDVYVTMGTVFNEDITTFETVLDGLDTADVTTVVTVGDHVDVSQLARRRYTHVERFVPQAELLPHCDLVITHGGAGSVLGGLVFGLPLVVLPRGADHFDNAASVAAAGAGIRILPHEATATSIGAAARAVSHLGSTLRYPN